MKVILRPISAAFLPFAIACYAYCSFAESAFNKARTTPIEGQVSGTETAVEVEVKAASMRSGAKCIYTAPVQAGQFSQSVKLFPGQNLVTAKTASGVHEQILPFSVGRSTLSIELSCGYPTYILAVNQSLLVNTDVFLEQGAVGMYSIQVFNRWEENGPFFFSAPTTVSVYVNEELVCRKTNSDGKFLWNVGTVVLHSGVQVGGYAVDGSRLDVVDQGGLQGISIHNENLNVWSSYGFIDYAVTGFSGPNGGGTVYLPAGAAAQFSASGTVYQHYSGSDQNISFIDCFTNSDETVGSIDALGVFVAKAPGHTQVSCEGYTGDPIDVYVVKAELIPDYDRDGTISDSDRSHWAEGGVFYFWINDDADIDSNSGSDIPGAQNQDSADNIVNGLRDLNDWFPVKIEVGQSADYVASETCTYWLCHEGGAVNILTDASGKPYVLFDVGCNNHIFDSEVAESVRAGTAIQVTASGIQLDASFIISALNGKATVLLEGRSTTRGTAECLTLEVRAKTDGRVVCRSKLLVSLDSVTGMYRQLNLRDVCGGAGGMDTQTAEPFNLPDSQSSVKHIANLHGYNINGTDATGEQSAVFKNLWWCGSRARFHAVSWFGDATQSPSFGYTVNFYTNGLNAFATAPYVSSYINELAQSGEVTALAHSLGNMVASAAFCLNGASAANYFMLDTAVAQEAYRSAPLMTHNMVNSHWADYTTEGYPNRLFASEWYTNFSTPDARSALTLRGLFTNWGNTSVCNFYSSGEGEDVLNNAPYHCADDWSDNNGLDAADNVWCAQEKLKGRIPDKIELMELPGWWVVWAAGQVTGFSPLVADLTSLADSWLSAFVNEAYPYKQGGWQINKANLTQYYSLPEDWLGVPHYRVKTLAEMLDPIITGEVVWTRFPIFTLPTELTATNDVAASAYAADNRFFLLTHVFPATSYAMGKNQIENESGIDNWDMNDLERCMCHGWWESDKLKWEHCDFKNVSLLYTQELYKEMARRGGLN